jgi:hypothetical protein
MTSDRQLPRSDDAAAQPALGARVRAELEQTSPEQAARLRALRSAAVKELDARHQRLHARQWWVAGGLAGSAASVALLVGLLIPARPLEQPFPDLDAEELAVVQSLDVLEELEFLAWMEEEANRAEAG